MLHIKLRGRQAPPADDTMNRRWIGYDPSVPVAELFEINRGRWKVNEARARRERYAVFSHEGEVKFVAELDGLEDAGAGRKIFKGQPLGENHPLAREWVGREAPDANRNPVGYFNPGGAVFKCACGCGGEVKTDRAFLPGHDQRAVHSRIAEGWGDVLKFIEWFDARRDKLGGSDG